MDCLLLDQTIGLDAKITGKPLYTLRDRDSQEYSLWHDGERNTMSHLLYMDDLKIYAGGPDKHMEAMDCMEKTSNAIGMRFGLRKCVTAQMQRGTFRLAQTTLNAVKNQLGVLKRVLLLSS